MKKGRQKRKSRKKIMKHKKNNGTVLVDGPFLLFENSTEERLLYLVFQQQDYSVIFSKKMQK